MDSKVIIIIAIAAVAAIGGATAAIIHSLNGNNNSQEDTTHVIYYHDESHIALKTTETTVKSADILKEPACFLTWNTKADRSGDYYNPGDKVELGTKLYAVWGTHYMSIGNIMSTVDTLKLELTISDDISNNRDKTEYLLGLSEKGEVTFALSGWYTVYKKFDQVFEGKMTIDGNYFCLYPDVDDATSVELWVDNNIAYFKATYDNTKDLTVSASWP